MSSFFFMDSAPGVAPESAQLHKYSSRSDRNGASRWRLPATFACMDFLDMADLRTVVGRSESAEIYVMSTVGKYYAPHLVPTGAAT
jgi:hypothetical protein